MVYLLLFIFVFLGLVAGAAWFCWDRYREDKMPTWLVIGLWVCGGLWFLLWSVALLGMLVILVDLNGSPPIPAGTTTTTIHAR